MSLRIAALQKKKSGGGVLAWLLDRRRRKPSSSSSSSSSPLLPGLQEPLPGVKQPPVLSDGEEDSGGGVETRMSKLANGLIVASENTKGPTATVGVYVDSGSVRESAGKNCGATHLLERMAFKSTLNRSHQRLVREMEAIGGDVLASASREQMCYTGDVIASYVPEVVELIADCVRNPAFHDWEVREQVAALKVEIEEMKNNPESLLLEALHPAGYTGALGNPLVVPHSALDKLDSRALHEFVAENFTPSRMVLAGSGVEHEHLISLAQSLFQDMVASVTPPQDVKSEYVGGDWRLQADDASDKVHVAVAFEIPGGWRDEATSVAATVLQSLLGGGGSFSVGGPGKGVHSRLYSRVLSSYSEVDSFVAFTSVYNDSGLFGINASSKPKFGGRLVDLITDELLAVASPGEITNMELERAKNATISLVLMNLESRVVVNEDIGRQILTYGCRKPAKEFIAAVEALTMDDICNVAQQIISTPVTMACYGQASKIPLLDDVSSRFH